MDLPTLLLSVHGAIITLGKTVIDVAITRMSIIIDQQNRAVF